MTDTTKRPVRRFRARNALVLPTSIGTGPGATNMRLDPDQVVELDADAVKLHERFINGRVRAGDLEELEEHVTLEPTASSPATTRRGSKDDGGNR